ncbi:HPr family phosphocarrier protein [Bacillus sp. ISL-41]|uniref:HPr family phosphocarrier protein n=1 Tax=Bacillus sp. ISL-41 TaxID=2819127 RepID=UPI001BE9C051|nr:HPr family phosphocarrier protein [Bacillus sp. ISL-41]MBT2641673.1 HPr family phosphocarrier protein [Bacillus sp. ISL-41]
MIERDITISIEKGLHARPAALLVKRLNEFASNVEFQAGGKRLNPKSIISLMTSVIKQGETVRVTVDGRDEQEAMDWLIKNL